MPLQVDKETELAIVRRAYAKQIVSFFEVNDARIEAAFAEVPRERYLGPGPWQAMRAVFNYVTTPSDDPVYLYTDRLFGLITGKGVNNGQPSLHAALLANAGVAVGEHVVHIGAGTGYYSAILAHLVGPAGRVTAAEFDPELASRAARSLLGIPNVHVLTGDACQMSFDPADVIYVNAGFSRIPLSWLDALRDGGRLILPMGTRGGLKDAAEAAQKEPAKVDMAKIVRLAQSQVMFRIERRGEEFHVAPGIPAVFIPAEAGDAVADAALGAAVEKGGARNVTRLYRSGDIPEERCWLRGEGWCLAYS
jgi:protein-L-isoaspartate(D-aspartate) O-methyltransferase